MDGNGHAPEISALLPDLPPGTDAHPVESDKTDALEELPTVETPRISVTDFSESNTTPELPEDQVIEVPESVEDVEEEPVARELPVENDVHESDDDKESIPPPTPSKHSVEVEESPSVPPTPPPRPPPPTERSMSLSTNGLQDSRAQSPTLSTTSGSSTNAHRRTMTSFQGHHMSSVLISSALDTIASSKEAKRSIPLKESTQKALELLQTNQAGEYPRDILEPLRLACETKNEKLTAISLDCISKLIGFDFFADEDFDLPQRPSPPPSPVPGRRPSGPDSQGSAPQPSLVDLVAHTIVSCYTETTSDTVSVQIVKAILNMVVSTTTIVHHSSLLKCIRTVYNIYMLSAEPRTQQVAQAALSQMVDHIFNRSKLEEQPRQSIDRRDSLAASTPDMSSEAPPTESNTSTPIESSSQDSIPSGDPPIKPEEQAEPSLDSERYISRTSVEILRNSYHPQNAA